jgi:hypothetical protein
VSRSVIKLRISEDIAAAVVIFLLVVEKSIAVLIA